MKVADVMTSPAHSCRAHEALQVAARIMWDHDTGVVPIVDAQGRAVAMITDRDICMAAYTQGKRLADVPIQEAMSKVVYTCHPEDKLTAAERTMRVHQVRRLPVVDDAGRIVGLLSLADICRARTRSPLGRVAEGLFRDLAVTLSAIGRPRTEVAHGDESGPETGPDPFEVQNLPLYRERETAQPVPRVPPPQLREPSSLFRL